MENRPKSAHRYNVQEQQEVYKEEIARIWKLQFESLSNPVEPQLTEEDVERQRGRGRRGGSMVADSAAGTPRDLGRGGSVGSGSDREDGMSVGSGRAP